MGLHDEREGGAVSPEWIGRAPHQVLRRGERPILPAKDPFYEPPEGFQHAEPNTVLRSRDVQLGFLGLIPQKIRATQPPALSHPPTSTELRRPHPPPCWFRPGTPRITSATWYPHHE